MKEALIVVGLLAWSFIGLRQLMRRPDNTGQRIYLVDALILGPMVLLMWIVLWLSMIRVAFKKRA